MIVRPVPAHRRCTASFRFGCASCTRGFTASQTQPQKGVDDPLANMGEIILLLQQLLTWYPPTTAGLTAGSGDTLV